MITIPGYKIESKIYQVNRISLYRGLRENDETPVVIKTASSEYPSSKDLGRLNYEYEITKGLPLKGILKPYSFLKTDRDLAVIFEDVGGYFLKTLNESKRLNLWEFLDIAIPLAETLVELHQTNVIHKNITPANIIVNKKTADVKLTDFSMASVLPQEDPRIISPSLMEGTLAYISPEQTGRMNRVLDYRTDFYSLGVTFYEVLTGKLPFQAKDPLELVHCHMAKLPMPPHETHSDIPKAISDIIMKLMAKMAEDRYQSASGLKVDLEKCRKTLEETGRIENFGIGRQDISEKFQIAQGLYGRGQETDILLALFGQVSQGKTEMAMVSGYAGIGKTSLVKEIYRLITEKRGYFVSGKFDQLQRNVPYNALVHAFQELTRELLTESGERLELWKKEILTAIGPNGQIIIDVIPDVKLIIGAQPPVAELGPIESQNRIVLVFRNFIRLFCKKEHPLVIFLDDLQWVDTATLKLIELMMSDKETQYLFLICAYRDNEVGPSHPLMVSLEKLQKRGAPITRVEVGALGDEAVNNLISGTINSDSESVGDLTNLLIQKTNGNPFFVNQFLMTLYEEDLIYFNPEQKKWQWEMSRIQALDITDNVVDLLISRFQRLPSETQNVLRLAACIGTVFDLKTLSLITKDTISSVFHRLLPALQDGLIIAISSTDSEDHLKHFESEGVKNFKFLHDRVQQATYRLINESDKEKVHLQIGRLLLESTPKKIREESVFDILNHLNTAKGLVTDKSERLALIELNLNAGRKAKVSAAYEIAFGYLKVALTLLDINCWKNKYKLALEIYNEATEAAYLAGHFFRMEELAKVVIQNARTDLDKVKVYQCRIIEHMAQNKLSDAIEAALEILELLGVKFEERTDHSDISDFVVQIQSVVDLKSTEELANFPPMKDPIALAILRILKDATICAYFTRFDLFVEFLFRGIGIIINYGHCPLSPFFYSFYGLVLCGSRGDIESGFKFGQLALDLLEKNDAKEIQCKTLLAFNVYIRHYKEHIRNTIAPLVEAYHAGLETGDLIYAAFAANAHCIRDYMVGTNLSILKKKFEIFDVAIQKTKQRGTLDINRIYHQAISNLLNDTEKPWMLIGEIYDEEVQLPFHLGANNRNALHYFYFNKLLLTCLFTQYDEAVENANMAEKFLEEVTGGLAVPIFHFYDSLARLGNYNSSSENEQNRIIKKVAANQERMKIWAENAPMNHLHRYHLVEAERCRILSNIIEASNHYDLAIKLAQENQYIHEEAYANELAGRFWFQRRKEEFAGLYMDRAHRGYITWGAISKVKDIEEKYHGLLPKRFTEHIPDDRSGPSGDVLGLDLSTMMKASQAISSEILLDRLLTIFMKIVVENVGAQEGFLILDSNGSLLIEARGGVDQDGVLSELSIPVGDAEDVATSIVTYVARTRKHVVLNNATEEGMFTSDPYVKSRHPKSILCAPLLHKNSLLGVLYLENNLISAAFTPERLEIVRILGSQIAISLENARLYGDVKKAEEEFRGIFQNAAEGIYRTTSDGKFLSANPAMAQMFEFESPKELIDSINDIEHQLYVSPERRNDFLALIQQQKAISGFEVEFYRKGGQRFWASLHSRPSFDENGKLLFIDGFVTDITDKRNAMEALLEREEYLRKENMRLRSNIKDRYKFGDIVGKSQAMQEVYELILRASGTDVNVIVYGESGTGKELVARAIHGMSDRKNELFVPVNSGAIPGNLTESEFFGYKKGAFTGATEDKHGYLDLANQGTLFLDELGEMDSNIQAKLLRAIEGGGYTPVGGTEKAGSNIRIIAATNRDLKEQVRKGLMREDFFYRIHIIPIYLPPLRERKEDIPLLIEHFLKAYEYEEKVSPITGNVLEAMLQYEWPGNVRELQNTLHRYVTLKRLDFLGAPLRTVASSKDVNYEPILKEKLSLREAVDNFEREYILRKLEMYQWHRTRVAAMLGINRKTLFKKMRHYGVQKPQIEA